MASTEQLERETEHTRTQLAATLDELRSITPGRVVDEILGFKPGTTAKSSTGDFLRSIGSDVLSGLGKQVVGHPMSATLIGAGIAWYLMSDGKTDGMAAKAKGMGKDWSLPTGQTGRSAMDTGTKIGEQASSAMRSVKETTQSAASSLSNAASSLSEAASDTYASARETVSDAYDTVADTANRTASTVKDAAAGLADSAQSALDASRGVIDFCMDQPLILAGLGLAIGAALGAAIPQTAAEDRLMGEIADQLKGQAQRLASEKLGQAKSAGQHMLDETTKMAKEEITQLVGDRHDQPQQSNLPSDQQTTGQTQQSGTEFRPMSDSPFH